MNLRNIQNKRGFLLGEETIKIIIGLIVIILLVVFLANLYYNKVKEEKQKQAFASISEPTKIKEKINLIAGGNFGPHEVNIIAPVGWYIFTFTGNEIRPNACAGENCLCICSKVYDIWFVDDRERQTEECDESGACLAITDLIGIDNNPIEILKKGGVLIVFKKETSGISISKI